MSHNSQATRLFLSDPRNNQLRTSVVKTSLMSTEGTLGV